jgi:very-short-patch-repair endonuclease
MSALQLAIASLGGAAATFELHQRGFGRETLRLAVRSGEVRRIRQGWYVAPDTPALLADAMRVGGRATCLSAAKHWNLWLPELPTELHVAVSPRSCELRAPDDFRLRLGPNAPCVVHWSDSVGLREARDRLMVSPAQAIHDLVRCVDIEVAFIATESALHAGLLTTATLSHCVRGLPAAQRVALGFAAGSSGSGLESRFIFRMRRTGLRIRQQVQIGVDRVDIVIGDRLVVELDGRGFHDHDADRARDARLSARGYRVLRFSYTQVMTDWPAVEASVMAAIARGDAR